MPNLCIIPARALQHPELTGTDIRVLCAIGLHTDRAGAGCWASSKTLCEEAGVSRNHFFISTKRLLAAGLVRRTSGQDSGGTSTYSIILDDEASPEIGTGGVTQNGTGASGKSVRGSGRNRDAPTINAPLNVPSNAPTTRGGRKTVEAGELVNAVRDERSTQFPNSLTAGWQKDFNDTELRVIKAVGIERILSTAPGKDGVLLAQVAQMLAEVHA